MGPILRVVLVVLVGCAVATPGLVGPAGRSVLNGPSAAPMGTVPARHAQLLSNASRLPQPAPAPSSAPVQWRSWNDSPPPTREWEGLTYDASDGYVVLFGGYDNVGNNGPPRQTGGHIAPDWAEGTYYNDTWIFRDQTWTELCSGTAAAPSCPVSPAYGPASMGYDPSLGEVVLVDSFAGTWLYHNGTWRGIAATGPYTCEWGGSCGQEVAPMTFDPQTGQLVMVDAFGATWAFSNQTWTEISASRTFTGCTAPGNSLYDDPALGELVYFCANNASSFGWVNGTWAKLFGGPATGTVGAAASVFDPDLDALLATIYHETAAGEGPISTWMLAGGAWTNVTGPITPTSHAPTQDWWKLLSWDGADHDALMLDSTDGYTYASGGFNQTWTLSEPLRAVATASPTQLILGQRLTLNWSVSGGIEPVTASVTSVPAGCAPPASGVPELCQPTSAGSWTFSVTATSPSTDESVGTRAVVVVAAPLRTFGQSDRGWGVVGEPVRFSLSLEGGEPPYRDSWSWGDGTVTGQSTASHAFSTVGWHTVTYSVVDAWGQVSTGTVTVYIDSAVAATISANVTATDVGVPVAFFATGIGGIGSYGARWSFPSGVSSTGLTATYAFVEPGPETVSASVADAVGATSTATTTVQVNPDPELSIAAGLQTPGDPGAITFSLEILGGTAPYSLNWTFGDGSGGTTSQQGASSLVIAHTFERAGKVTVDANVTDAVGVHVQEAVTVVVGGTPATNQKGPPVTESASSVGMTSFDTAWLVIVLVVALSAGSVGTAAWRSRGRRRRDRSRAGTRRRL